MDIDNIPEADKAKLIKEVRSVIKRARAQKHEIDVTKLIPIHMVFDGDETKGWVHTHLMWELFDLPDLEIRGVSPLFQMVSCGEFLNDVAQYMVDFQGEKEVKAGQTMNLHGCMVRFEEASAIPGDEEHFKTPRFTVKDVVEAYKCVECEKGAPGHGGHD